MQRQWFSWQFGTGYDICKGATSVDLLFVAAAGVLSSSLLGWCRSSSVELRSGIFELRGFTKFRRIYPSVRRQLDDLSCMIANLILLQRSSDHNRRTFRISLTPLGFLLVGVASRGKSPLVGNITLAFLWKPARNIQTPET